MIQTLIKDIYSKVSKKDGWFSPELSASFAKDVADRLSIHLNETNTPRLRLSKMGPQCPRALWYSVNAADLAEPLPAWANIKYGYGHIVEAYALMLAEASGHRVEGKQDELVVDGISGHRDVVLDGCLVDVKSCSSISFNKFKDGSIRQNDTFGYLDQLDGYLVGCADDPLVHVKDRAYIFAVDQVKGHMCLYEHIGRRSILDRIKEYKEIVSLGNPPACLCGTVPDGKSGNVKLDTKASYSPYKYCCFPNVRLFLYSDGPRYLTHVARLPDVPEIDRDGNFIRH